MWNKTVYDAPDEQIVGSTSPRDKSYQQEMQAILEKTPHSLPHMLSHWPAYVRRIHFTRFMAHYELFRKTLDIPGSIVELGVSRGVSFFTWHKLLEVFAPADTARKVYGFDSFEGLTDFTESDGISAADALNDKKVGGWSAAGVEDEIFGLARLANADNVLARERSRLIKGRVQETLPPFLAQTPGLRISLLHFDLDLYEPTIFALEQLWDLVVPGGVVIFDEYALPPWGGEATAFDEFVRRRGLDVRLHKFRWCLTPTAYVIKGERFDPSRSQAGP